MLYVFAFSCGNRSLPHHASGALKRTAALLVLLAASACAETPDDPVEREVFLETNDPAEPVNRAVFDFDMTILDGVLSPVALAYRDNVPGPIRDGVGNVLDNLQMPVTILNSALQGDVDNMMVATGSLVINSTIGLGGILDISTGDGRKPRREDFGQTLAVWGVDEGAYVVLPVAGPSTVRDTIGLGVDILADPLTWILTPVWSYARSGAETIDTVADEHDRLDDVRRSSLDFYVGVRSLYRQQRARQIANGDIDPFADDPFEDNPVEE